MQTVETLLKIRRLYYVEGKGYKTIARLLKMSKNTVKRLIRADKVSLSYERKKQTYRVLDAYQEKLIESLEADEKEPKRRKRTASKLYEELQGEGYQGSYSAVNAFVVRLRRERRNGSLSVGYVPLGFEVGEAFQFDWSDEEIELGGSLTRVKVAHFHLCYSRMPIIQAYPNEQLEMLMLAHDECFEWLGGVCRKGIYDNMKTAVEKVWVGKDRKWNRRFLELVSHHLFEPTACTPGAGWEKGQVERQVQTSRSQFFTPLVKVKTWEELNERLKSYCLKQAQKALHPEYKDQTVFEVYQKEKGHLLSYRGAFGGYKVVACQVHACGLVYYETNEIGRASCRERW